MTEKTVTTEECISGEIKGETWEVVQYLAMALKADNEGKTEVAQTLRSIALDEAGHGPVIPADRHVRVVGMTAHPTRFGGVFLHPEP